MDIQQDPNAIPNFNRRGRLGETPADEPEQAQSSVMPDLWDDDDELSSAHDFFREERRGVLVRPRQVTSASRTATGERETAGAVDGLVGAP